jgi:CHAD domain-containing protein
MNTETWSRPETAVSSGDDISRPSGLGELICHRLGRSIERLENPAFEPAWVVHEVRKDLKCIRALLRLAGHELPTRQLERDCAEVGRRLAPLRNLDAAGETVTRLRARADGSSLAALEELATWLLSQLPQGEGERGLPWPIAEASALKLRAVLAELQSLSFEGLDSAALDRGLAVAWSDTAAAFRRVMDKPAGARFHALRKAVKRELHQRELAGRPLDLMERATLKKLAEVLGELQDLQVLREALGDAGRWRGPVRKLAKQTRRELKARAIRLGGGRYPEESS